MHLPKNYHCYSWMINNIKHAKKEMSLCQKNPPSPPRPKINPHGSQAQNQATQIPSDFHPCVL